MLDPARPDRVVIADHLAPEGIEILERAGFTVDVRTGLPQAALALELKGCQVLIVRSATRVTAELIEAAPELRVIGRAGLAVDHIDLAAATRRGIVVMNAPSGLATSVAEHALALIFAVIRRISEADRSLRAGRWEKPRLAGRELRGKTLGVIGLGTIGSLVAERARALGMKVIGCDPFVSDERARALGVTRVDLDMLWPEADVVSLHVPATPETRHLVNPATLAQMKPGGYLVNCSRGGVVDEDALAAALRSGQLAGAALDVFETEPPDPSHPLFALETFVATPRIGASTPEAQGTVARQLAEQIVRFLKEGVLRNAVNAPNLGGDTLTRLAPWLTLAERLGNLAGQLWLGATSELVLTVSGKLAQQPLAPLAAQALKGLFAHFSDEPVNEYNAPILAEERGMQIRTEVAEGEASRLGVSLRGPDRDLLLAGTLSVQREPRLVRLGDWDLDVLLAGTLLVVTTDDVPRMVGQLGMQLGEAGVNIGRLHLERSLQRGHSFMIFAIDSPCSLPLLEQLRRVPHVIEVAQVRV
jgi:D-3-phosphoglycerate dehydrogenase/(S)-sulfolactate dehydrogenase